MKLSKKNLIYSMILAGCLMCMLVGYFIFMLPSLYVEHMKSRNLDSIIEQHRGYMRDGDYNRISVNNPVACFSLEIPFEEDDIYISMKVARAKIEPESREISDMISEIKGMIHGYAKTEEGYDFDALQAVFEKDMEFFSELINNYRDMVMQFPFSLTVLESYDFEDMFSGEHTKYHRISENLYVLETNVQDANNQYMNYFACSVTDESIVISYLPVMAPQMNEITPVIMQSIPMLAAVLILFVLIFSMVYSKGIVAPIVSLAAKTKCLQWEKMQWKSQNVLETQKGACEEIRLLSETINSLYMKLQKSCLLLEEKNEVLAQENERQEVFLRASSHQLKTPIAAALLLVDGMKNKVGKYRDTDTYLPEVKKQLLYMKKTVEDVLYLNHLNEIQEFTQVDIGMLTAGLFVNYDVMLKEKEITVSQSMETPLIVKTDEVMAGKMIDNLISNAVAYTPQGGTISVTVSGRELHIRNSGVSIPEALLEHIYEPFVSGSKEGKYRGLGLYISSYYAKHLGVLLTIQNENENENAEENAGAGKTGVIAKLQFAVAEGEKE